MWESLSLRTSSGRSSAAPPSCLRCERLEERTVPSAFGLFAVGAGQGAPPRVQVFNTSTGQRIADFLAFESTFTGGVNVALGDVNADGTPDLLVGAGIGGGPRVRVFNGAAILAQGGAFSGQNVANVLLDFFAYESTQRGGVYVSVGNFLGGGSTAFLDLVIGAGPGGGPRVRILDGFAAMQLGRNYTSFGPGETIADFFAFESTFRNGVTVAGGASTVGGTGVPTISNLAVSPGFGGGPRVRLLNGQRITQLGTSYTSFQPGDAIVDFFAYPASLRSGVYVALADVNNDNVQELITGPGPNTTPIVNVFSGQAMIIKQNAFQGNQPGDLVDSFVQAPTTNYQNGVTVGSALRQLTGDFLLTGVGGPNDNGTAFVYQYVAGAGFAQRQLVLQIPFVPPINAGVFVSN